MKEHPNFYETVDEVRIRLKDTVVMYDGHPYYVLNVANHKKDGIFRLYLDPLAPDDYAYSGRSNYSGPHGWSSGDNASAARYDEWMDATKNCPVLRKQMNSPLFGKFRPFPLGMCNLLEDAGTVYLVRGPTRSTYQGLTGNSIKSFSVSLNMGSDSSSSGYRPHIISPEMCRTILGQYPTPEECLEHLLNPKSANNALAFHREFCFLRGPLDLIFLVYKTDVVGSLVENNLSRVMLGRQFKHLREVVQELGVFSDVV